MSFKKIINGLKMNLSSFSKRNREQQACSAASASLNNKKTIVLKKRSKERSSRSQVLQLGKTMTMMMIKIKIKIKRNTHKLSSIKKTRKMPLKELKMSYRELVINQMVVEAIHSKCQMLMASSQE